MLLATDLFNPESIYQFSFKKLYIHFLLMFRGSQETDWEYPRLQMQPSQARAKELGWLKREYQGGLKEAEEGVVLTLLMKIPKMILLAIGPSEV